MPAAWGEGPKRGRSSAIAHICTRHTGDCIAFRNTPYYTHHCHEIDKGFSSLSSAFGPFTGSQRPHRLHRNHPRGIGLCLLALPAIARAKARACLVTRASGPGKNASSAEGWRGLVRWYWSISAAIRVAAIKQALEAFAALGLARCRNSCLNLGLLCLTCCQSVGSLEHTTNKLGVTQLPGG